MRPRACRDGLLADDTCPRWLTTRVRVGPAAAHLVAAERHRPAAARPAAVLQGVHAGLGLVRAQPKRWRVGVFRQGWSSLQCRSPESPRWPWRGAQPKRWRAGRLDRVHVSPTAQTDRGQNGRGTRKPLRRSLMHRANLTGGFLQARYRWQGPDKRGTLRPAVELVRFSNPARTQRDAATLSDLPAFHLFRAAAAAAIVLQPPNAWLMFVIPARVE